MSVTGIATAAAVANHAQTAQAINIAVQKQQHEAAQSIVQMLEQAITPVADSGRSGEVDISV